MTATTLTYIVAREHISDLRREAERRRRASEAATPRTVRHSVPRLLPRRIGRTAAA
jgi:hypothetical protein